MSNIKKVKLETLFVSNNLMIGKDRRPIKSYIDNLHTTIEELQVSKNPPRILSSVKNNGEITLTFSQPIFAISLFDFHFYDQIYNEIHPSIIRKVSDTEFVIEGCGGVYHITISPTNRIVNHYGITMKSETRDTV